MLDNLVFVYTLIALRELLNRKGRHQMKAIYITKDGQIGDAEGLLIVKNLSDNRVEILKESPTDLKQRLALDFVDEASDVTYFDGEIWKSTMINNKDKAWDWLSNDYAEVWNKEAHLYDIYRNGILVDDATTRVQRSVDALINSNK
jgi:hypothetical protein